MDVPTKRLRGPSTPAVHHGLYGQAARGNGPGFPGLPRAGPALTLALLVSLWAGAAAGRAAEDEKDRRAVPVKRTVTAVFQFVRGWNVGSPKGTRGYSVLKFLALPGGKRLEVRTDWGVLETLTPGRAYKCTVDFRSDTRWLTSCEEYNLQPWELRPRIYQVKELVEEDLPGRSRAGLRVRRLGARDIMWVAQRRTEDGGLEPDPEMLKALRRYKPGTLVHINCRRRGRTLIIRTIREYIPPQRGEYLGKSTQRVGGRDRLAVRARTGRRDWTLVVFGRFNAAGEFVGDRRIMRVLKDLDPGQEVTFTAREDDGHVWLESIRPVEEKRAPTGDGRLVPGRDR